MAIGKILYKSMYWKFFQLALSFFINLFLTRHFRSAISAEFYSFVYILSLFATFFTLGLDIGLNYYLSRRQITPRAACRIIAGVTVLALVISLPLLYLLFHPARFPDLSPGRWLFFSACHITGVLLTSLSGTIFTAYGQNYRPAQYISGINIVLAVLLFVMSVVCTGSRLVESLFFLYFLFSFLQGAILFAVALVRYAGAAPGVAAAMAAGTTHQPVGLRELLGFSFMAFITNFIFFLGGRLGIYLLPYRVNAAEQGNYIQAYKLVEYCGLIASFIYYPFIAIVAAQDKEKTKEKLLLFLVRLSNTAVLFFSLLMLVFGKALLPFIYGRSFEGMYGIFVCFIPGLFPVCSSTFFTAWFYGAGRLKYNFISSCIQLSATFILFFLLAGIGGARGVALAYSLAGMASMAYDCIVFGREAPYRPAALFLARGQDWRIVRDFVGQITTKINNHGS